MRNRSPIPKIFLLSCIFFAACGAEDASEVDDIAIAILAPTELSDHPAPDVSGEVVLGKDGTGEVTVRVSLRDCSEGEHAMHIHEGMRCGADGSEAGMHWTGYRQKHNDSDHADEDLSSIGLVRCGPDGKGDLTFRTQEWNLGDGSAADPTGHAVVLHDSDDPDVRIACGVIEPL